MKHKLLTLVVLSVLFLMNVTGVFAQDGGDEFEGDPCVGSLGTLADFCITTDGHVLPAIDEDAGMTFAIEYGKTFTCEGCAETWRIMPEWTDPNGVHHPEPVYYHFEYLQGYDGEGEPIWGGSFENRAIQDEAKHLWPGVSAQWTSTRYFAVVEYRGIAWNSLELEQMLSLLADEAITEDGTDIETGVTYAVALGTTFSFVHSGDTLTMQWGLGPDSSNRAFGSVYHEEAYWSEGLGGREEGFYPDHPDYTSLSGSGRLVIHADFVMNDNTRIIVFELLNEGYESDISGVPNIGISDEEIWEALHPEESESE